MVSSIGASQTVGTDSLAEALGGDESLDKEAFLKLLVAQLEHQDPLEPKENSEFVAELAQFTSLEQTMGINDRLDMLALQNQGMANTQIAGLMGQRATVRGNIATLDQSGAAVPIRFSLGDAAQAIKVSVRNESGTVVREMELGSRPAGMVDELSWDGLNDNGVKQSPGRYTISVSATGDSDEAISVTQEVTGQVKSVSFDKGFPQLTLDNGIAVPVADLLRVEQSQTAEQ